MSKSSGVCEHCHQVFDYSLIHNGFNDSAYAYCDTCGCTAVISAWSPKPEGVPVRVHQRIGSDVENYLDRCACGGKFTAGASPRCPFCRSTLSAIEATTWIEANAPGTAKGWRWQKNWSGLYCIVIANHLARDPWKRELSLVGVHETVTLYRPVGPEELQLIKRSGCKTFPPRRPEQPIFYPVSHRRIRCKNRARVECACIAKRLCDGLQSPACLHIPVSGAGGRRQTVSGILDSG